MYPPKSGVNKAQVLKLEKKNISYYTYIEFV